MELFDAIEIQCFEFQSAAEAIDLHFHETFSTVDISSFFRGWEIEATIKEMQEEAFKANSRSDPAPERNSQRLTGFVTACAFQNYVIKRDA